MKKILVIGLNMEIGGAERALLGLLNSFDIQKYEVDLFLQKHEGPLMKYIPKNINLLKEIKEYTTLATPMTKVLKEGYYFHILGRLYAKMRAKIFNKRNSENLSSAVELEYSHKYTRNYMPMISDDTYNLVISFCCPHYFGMEKTKGLKKISWIHTDYASVYIDSKSEEIMWNKYDKIISISDKCTQSFLEKMPTLKDKIIRIDNIITKEMIMDQSNAFDVNEMNGEIKLLSIGRFSVAKNFDNVPNICKRILDKGLNVKWYLIGYGGDEQLIKDKIKEEGMEDYVIMLGKKDNPYPYIKACDFYIQPSRYEGKAVTVREAQILEKPVIITRYATSSSQLDEGIDGVIVPMDNEGCAQGIVDFINNKELQDKIVNYLKEKDYSNSDEVNKIYELID